MNSNN
jgi:hypothetical protein